MKKTIIAISVCLILIVTGSLNAISRDVEEDTDVYAALTFGTAWLNLFAEVEITDGDPDQINEVEQLLDRKSSNQSGELFVYLPVEEMTFTVNYKLRTRLFSRFCYRSIDMRIDIDELYNIENISNIDEFWEYIRDSFEMLKSNISYKFSKRHSYTYENFSGIFVLIYPRIARILPPKLFIPAKFAFVGICDEIVVN
jgi:hypothetical protein